MGSPEAKRLRGSLLHRRKPMTDEANSKYVKALLEERKSVEKRGLSERVEAIDAELKRVGHEAKKPVERARKATIDTGTKR